MAYTQHGHHIPGSPISTPLPKTMARCGGCGLCQACSLEALKWTEEETARISRPSWDEWGLILATAVATRADCSRRKVGAVLMRPDHTIVSTGYNGAKPGGGSCLKGECPRGRMSKEEVPPYDAANPSSYDVGAGACIALHAEQNALLRATWDEMQGATLYITDEPCPGCKRMINGTPINRIHYPEKDNN